MTTRTPPPPRGLRTELVAFALIGVASTVVHLGLFVLLRVLAPAQAANAVALVLATVANTGANRRWTFGVRGRAGVVRQQVQGFVILGLTLATTAAGLALLGLAWPGAPRWVETATVAAATLLSTAVKYLAMRTWMFSGRSGLAAPTRAG